MDGREFLAVVRRRMQGSGSAMSMSPPADTVGSRLRAGRARRAPLGATIGGRRHHTASQVAGCPGVGHRPLVGDLRDRRACDIPFRALLATSKAWGAVPVVRDGEPCALTNRANAQTKCLAAPCFERSRPDCNRPQPARDTDRAPAHIRAR